jgi:hypothetical protein
MPTSQQTSFLYEIGAGLPIPIEKRAYFQARLLNRIYGFILNRFLEQERSHGLTKAELARRIGKRPETVSRLLGAPGNWELETISDLLLGINGEELEFSASSVLSRATRNYVGPDWIKVPSSVPLLGAGPTGPAMASLSAQSEPIVTNLLRGSTGSFVPAIQP